MKNNPRITRKERGLLKGAMRRVFSRSELRLKVLSSCRIEHSDSSRPRVTKWGRCEVCKNPEPLYKMAIDHKIPVIEINRDIHSYGADELVDRIWSEESNLQAICDSCHNEKTSQERKLRNAYKKSLNKSNNDVKVKNRSKNR